MNKMAFLALYCLAFLLGSTAGDSQQIADDHSKWMQALVSGVPGVDFPDYTTVPQTNFSCSDYGNVSGFYADVESRCQVFHVCYEGRMSSFLCPVRTLFNQELLTCDFWHRVNCPNSPLLYPSPAVLMPRSTHRDTSLSLRAGRALDLTNYEYSGDGNLEKMLETAKIFTPESPFKDEDFLETLNFGSGHDSESAPSSNSLKTTREWNIQTFTSTNHPSTSQSKTTASTETVTTSVKLPETAAYTNETSLTLDEQSTVTAIVTELGSSSVKTEQPYTVTITETNEAQSTEVSNVITTANSVETEMSQINEALDLLETDSVQSSNGSATATFTSTVTSTDFWVNTKSPHTETSSVGSKNSIPGTAVTEPLPSVKPSLNTENITSELITKVLSTVSAKVEAGEEIDPALSEVTNDATITEALTKLSGEVTKTSQLSLVTQEVDGASTSKPYYSETLIAGSTLAQLSQGAETLATTQPDLVNSTTSPDVTSRTKPSKDYKSRQRNVPVVTKPVKIRTKLNFLSKDKSKPQQLSDLDSPKSSVGRLRLRKYRQSTEGKPQPSTEAVAQPTLVVPGVRKKGKLSKKIQVKSQNSNFDEVTQIAKVLKSTEAPKTSDNSASRLRLKTRRPRIN